MEKLGQLLIVIGVLVLIYTLIGTFVGSVYLFSYLRPIKPATALILANSLLLLGIAIKTTKK